MKKRIPRFRSEEEETRFWDTHDSTDYLDEFKDDPDTAFVRRASGPDELSKDTAEIRNSRERRTISLPRGVIFDMDGVLLDSEPFICKAACMMFAELGLQVKPEDFIPFVGAGENRYIGGVAEKYNFPIEINAVKKRTYEIYLEIIRGQLHPLPGVHAYLDACRMVGKKMALATSADRIKAEGNLREIDLPMSTFDAIITGLDVVNKKPHPEIFLTAAERLGLDARDCLVVEDAVNGVAAARAAGSRCLALTTSFTRGQLAGADWFAPTLAEAPPEALHWS